MFFGWTFLQVVDALVGSRLPSLRGRITSTIMNAKIILPNNSPVVGNAQIQFLGSGISLLKGRNPPIPTLTIISSLLTFGA